jgi:hypothetical protein
VFVGPVALRGAEATIVWGYHTAAVCSAWTVERSAAPRSGAGPPTWTLRATLARADPFKLRQAPLKFTAPRRGGFFCWPILSVTVGAASLTAHLGPPEG